MSKYIRTIYLYIISFIALGMITIGLVQTISSCVELKYPTNYIYFRENNIDNKYIYDIETEQNEKIEKENAKRGEIKEIATEVAVTILGIVIYKYHWNKIQKEEGEA